MALDFALSSTDKVTIAAASSINSLAAATYLMWVWQDTTPGVGVFFGMCGKGAGPTRHQLSMSSSNVILDCRNTTAVLKANATVANMSSIGNGKWYFLGASYDLPGAATCKLFHGDLATAAAEPAAYALQDTGAGTIADDSASSLVVGTNNDGDATFDGKIAAYAIFNRALTLAEIISWQRHPRMMSGCVGLHHYGFVGTGTQPDYSGSGNSGTVTGAVVAAHAPMRPLYGADLGWQGAFTAAAAASSVHRQLLLGVGI